MEQEIVVMKKNPSPVASPGKVPVKASVQATSKKPVPAPVKAKPAAAESKVAAKKAATPAPAAIKPAKAAPKVEAKKAPAPVPAKPAKAAPKVEAKKAPAPAPAAVKPAKAAPKVEAKKAPVPAPAAVKPAKAATKVEAKKAPAPVAVKHARPVSKVVDPNVEVDDQFEEMEEPVIRHAVKKAALSGTDEEMKRLSSQEIKEFCDILQEKRGALIESARDTLAAQEELEVRAPDEVDQASTEYDQSFEYRMRDREKFLLRKIEKALARIDEGEYDLCESCGNPIGRKRLMARPETTYCIVCKEDQERQEKMFQKKRQMRATLEF
jgi:RNA polymerase-binding protein DksA